MKELYLFRTGRSKDLVSFYLLLMDRHFSRFPSAPKKLQITCKNLQFETVYPLFLSMPCELSSSFHSCLFFIFPWQGFFFFFNFPGFLFSHACWMWFNVLQKKETKKKKKAVTLSQHQFLNLVEARGARYVSRCREIFLRSLTSVWRLAGPFCTHVAALCSW